MVLDFFIWEAKVRRESIFQKTFRNRIPVSSKHSGWKPSIQIQSTFHFSHIMYLSHDYAYAKLFIQYKRLKHDMRKIKFWLDLYGRFASRVLPLWYVYNILLSTYLLPIISSFSNIFCTKSANRVACQLVFLNWVSSMKLLLSLICNFWLFLSVLESSWSHQLLALRIWFEKKN